MDRPLKVQIHGNRGVFADDHPPLGEKAAGCTFFPLIITLVYLICNLMKCLLMNKTQGGDTKRRVVVNGKKVHPAAFPPRGGVPSAKTPRLPRIWTFHGRSTKCPDSVGIWKCHRLACRLPREKTASWAGLVGVQLSRKHRHHANLDVSRMVRRPRGIRADARNTTIRGALELYAS